MSLEQREIPEGNEDLDTVIVARQRVNRLSLLPRILKAAAGVTGIPYELVNSDRRSQVACRARFMAMYVAFNYYNMSMALIGKRMHGRHHTTVISGIKRANVLIKTDALFKVQLEEVLQIIVGTTLMPVMVPMEALAPESLEPPKIAFDHETVVRTPEYKADEDIRRITRELVDRLRECHPNMEDQRVMVRMRVVA